ncbi:MULTISPECIES: hypothetical protein [Caballeronia]|uniref:Lipoprotein n=1 Tax=Caballeronia jiangsuensis TaxID=1458357 RepID=A0ABW9CVC0_9BURK|nr:hypothetical protein [Caballeronia sp. GaOx3]
MTTTEKEDSLEGVSTRPGSVSPYRRLGWLLLAVAVPPLLCACPASVQNRAYKDYRPAPLVTKGEPIDSEYDSLVVALVQMNYLSPQCFGDPSSAQATPLDAGITSGPVRSSTPTAASAPVAASSAGAKELQEIYRQSCLVQRNFIVTDLMSKSRAACEAHKATIFGNEASWNIALGTLTNVFTGTAAVVGGPMGKSILSALGLFSNATRSLINEEVYQKLLAPAIAVKIDEIRTAKASDIRTKLSGNSSTTLSDYPMQTALLDVMEYHDDCSFMLGLQTALREGTGSSINSKYAVLKRTEQDLSSAIDLRTTTVRSNAPKGADDKAIDALLNSDKMLIQLNTRLTAVGAQLQALEGLQATQTGGN